MSSATTPKPKPTDDAAMDPASSLSLAGSPAPLQPVSDERVNQQRDSPALLSSLRGGLPRDSPVHDKINQFNSMTSSKAAPPDAALRRAMLARDQAENDMRRHRDEAGALRRQLDEGKTRERRVGERLETVMVRLSPFERRRRPESSSVPRVLR